MNKENSSKGIGFTGVLTIVFITLKLLGAISWNWVWVLSPILINIGLGLLVIVAVIIYMVIKEVC